MRLKKCGSWKDIYLRTSTLSIFKQGNLACKRVCLADPFVRTASIKLNDHYQGICYANEYRISTIYCVSSSIAPCKRMC
uniref:Putative ovule protein n=1 Tax=Solanum chacoense TaxID=4108 RepID=A0A0V0I444_SOLCH